MIRYAGEKHALLYILPVFAVVLGGSTWLLLMQSRDVTRVTGGKRAATCNASIEALNALITQPAQIHGFVKKAGMLPLKLWHSSQQEYRTDIKEKALIRSLADNPSAAQDNFTSPWGLPSPPSGGCMVYYNDDYKYIYVRHPKSGSSAVFHDGLDGLCSDDGGKSKPSCGRFLQNLSPKEVEWRWREYFVFTFVRNPFTRIPSGYHFLEEQKKAGLSDEDKATCTLPWETVCNNVNTESLKCFIKPECCRFGAHFASGHLRPQAPCSFGPDGLPVVDFIGRQENSFEDFELMAEHINKIRKPKMPKVKTQLNWWKTKVTSKRPNEGALSPHVDAYTGHHRFCIERVFDSYSRDFELFKFDTTGLEQVCQ